MKPTCRIINSTVRAVLIGLVVGACTKTSPSGPPGATESATHGTLLHTVTYVPGPAWDLDKSMGEQGLADHIAYMGGLFEEGTLVANGPYGDSIRGLYVLALATREEAAAVVAEDPAVRSGILVLDRIEPWYVMMHGFEQDAGDKKFFLLDYGPGPSWALGKSLAEQDIDAHMGYVGGLYEHGELLVGGPIPGDDRGRYVVMGDDMGAAEKIVRDDPAVRAALFSVEIHPWTPMQRQSPGRAR